MSISHTNYVHSSNVSPHFHQTSCHHCCYIVPKYIFEDLSLLNGENIPLPPAHMGAGPGAPRLINIQHTPQSARENRIYATARPIMQMPPAPVMGAAGPAPKVPSFPVYDLDGATDLVDSNYVPEYKKKLENPQCLLPEPDTGWPDYAKRARATSQKVYQFFSDVFGRNSIDDLGMDIRSCVRFRTYVITTDPHSGQEMIALRYGQPIRIPENNAFWDGSVMAYGEGDGMIFRDFTASEDVIAHELSHGVTEKTCKLRYLGQSGALNEHISDVFGAIFRHWDKKMDNPQTANWFIGDDCIDNNFQKMVETRKFGHWHALRSMSEPGTAYSVTNGGSTGKDRQPAHMNDYKTVSYDNGGVHINSGIPNKAFYLFATLLGGKSWEIPGKVWYNTIVAAQFGKLGPNPFNPRIIDREATFKEFAEATIVAAKKEYDQKNPQVAIKLTDAWKKVGVLQS